MNRKILRNPAQAFLQGRELGKAEVVKAHAGEIRKKWGMK